MIVSTTPTIEGRRIKEYLGIVSGEAVLGGNTLGFIFVRNRDLVGGRAGGYEKEFRSTREEAVNDMVAEAVGLGGIAVVGTAVVLE